MGGLLDVLPHETEAGAYDEKKEEKSNFKRGNDFLVITNTPESTLHFNPAQSRLLAFGINQQIHPSYQHKTLGDTVKLDTLEVALTFLKQHNIKEFDVFTSSDNTDQCTRDGMKQALERSAQKVGIEGILVVFFGGHGISDANQKWALAPADFDLTPNTYITASDLTECLTNAKCQAKYILLILDCCYAGIIASGLTKGQALQENNSMLSNVYVLASGTELQSSFNVSILGHSIFSYFLTKALSNKRSRLLSPEGILPLNDIYEECKICSQALSSLMLSLNKDGNDVKVCEMVPSLSYFAPHFEEMGHEEDVDFEAAPARLLFVMKLLELYRCSPQPSPSLHQLTLQWLRKLVQYSPNPLSELNDRGLLADTYDNGRVLKTVIAFMMRSIAYIELVHNKDALSHPRIFLIAFVNIVSTIDIIHQGISVQLEHLSQGRNLYHRVLVENNIDDTLLKELFKEMDALKASN